jgi:hypothetical protein
VPRLLRADAAGGSVVIERALYLLVVVIVVFIAIKLALSLV